MPFARLGLEPALLQAISDQNYQSPTPIQESVIPLILAGHDVLAGAQTGTGKTAGFTLPMLQMLAAVSADQANKTPKALVLTPTRELALQVSEAIKVYGKYLPIRSQAIVGGVNMAMQTRLLKQGVDIVIATPGRLLDHVQQRNVNLSNIEILVLDEADRMLDMGFLPEIKRVIALLPNQRQTLLFSATFSNAIQNVAQQWLKQPKHIQVGQTNSTAEKISEQVYAIPREYKRELVSYLIGSKNWRQVLIFVRTKHGADRLQKQLITDGIKTAALHGDKTQAARNKALDWFKTGAVQALVATDVAARGLDIDDLPIVVNFDLPQVAEDYIHRIGRTGRAGATGHAISLVCPEEAYQLAEIEKFLQRKLPRVADTGYEPVSLSVQPDNKKSHKPNASDKTTTPKRKSTSAPLKTKPFRPKSKPKPRQRRP